MKEVSKLPAVDCVMGVESGGFLFSPLIAIELSVPFIAIRKMNAPDGKVTYDLQHGKV